MFKKIVITILFGMATLFTISMSMLGMMGGDVAENQIFLLGAIAMIILITSLYIKIMGFGLKEISAMPMMIGIITVVTIIFTHGVGWIGILIVAPLIATAYVIKPLFDEEKK